MDISNGYRKLGVNKFYEQNSSNYVNPHAYYIEQCLNFCSFSTNERILDVGCGDGLISKLLNSRDIYQFFGIDKFMIDRYKQETGFDGISISFEEISTNGLPEIGRFDTAICSYVTDIIPESYIHNFFWNLSNHCNRIIVIRPNNHLLNFNWMHLVNFKKVGKSKLTEYEILK